MTPPAVLPSVTQSFGPHKSNTTCSAICLGGTVKVVHFCFDSLLNNLLKIGAHTVKVLK